MKALAGLGVLWGLLALPAHAQVVKCRSETGQLVYTEKHCPPGTQPLDLAKPLSAPPRAEPAAAVRTPALSLRAEELKPYVFDCVHSTRTECNEYQQMYRACMDKQNRGTPDCRALVELLPLADRADIEKLRQELRATCREQGSEGCKRSTCAVLAGREPDDARIQDCAQSRGLPTAKSWALVSEKKDQAGNWTGIYVCFPKYRFLGPIGQPMWQRGQISVEAQMRGGRPTGSYILLGYDVFASRGCGVRAAERRARREGKTRLRGPGPG